MNGQLRIWALGLVCASCAWAQQQLPMEPPHTAGQSVTGAFEGWFSNSDGTFSILLGYFNRNTREDVDIPVGPNNHIDPGGPDRGQPTHFVPGRMWGNFVIKVPKDFGSKKLTWTIVANGKPTVIPMSLATDWEVSPFVDGTKNTPPFIGFSESGPFVNGPVGHSAALSASVGSPLPLPLWIADDAHTVPGMPQIKAPPVTLRWTKFRGPGVVTFSNERPPIEKIPFKAPENTAFSGKSTTTATFSEPGDYILSVVANDWTGEGGRGFQCCWTNAQVKVSVH
ncbi:MAG TPA: hypothetical protein VKR43_09365 [Bryobacteraceae bacterium]|nr:hypothetical protein [Bryobacteraceae bacterium]